jgi:hypothetical protein
VVVRRGGGERFRDDRVHVDDPPEIGWIIEVSVGRERLKARVISVEWPDRMGLRPAEVLVQEY